MQPRTDRSGGNRIPKLRNAAVGGREYLGAVAAECDVESAAFTGHRHGDQLTRFDAPETRGLVGTGRRETFAIRTESGAVDRILMRDDYWHGFEGHGIPKLATRILADRGAKTPIVAE